MQFSRHVEITGGALRDWFVAQCYDSVAVGLLWWAGLNYLHVPLAPFWAFLAAVFQFVPHFGPVLAFLGPAIAAILAGGLETFLWALGLYALIAVLDGLLLQPILMRRTAKVPIWASLIVPIMLSLMLGFWGLLVAAPLLAVIFAYRGIAKQRAREAAARNMPRQTPPGRDITGGVLLGPEETARRNEER
ncbi:MAG TPA: AI-2E family transporter [Candidatus Eisenbacteria bacterium]|nr:AI-2E family transporter [Candidatus Eisenbacteria bacterium]